MRTYSPVRLVTNNSRPYLLSSGPRKSPGTLSRPRSSMRAGEFPLNTDKSAIKIHFRPEKSTAIVEKPHAEVNRKTYGISKLRRACSLFRRPPGLIQLIVAYGPKCARMRDLGYGTSRCSGQ